MSTNLPTDVAATYPDQSPGDTAHQQHHDQIHAYTNTHDTAPDPHGDRAYADAKFVAKAGDTAWRSVGASGEPAFTNGWLNFGSVHATAAFRMDSGGYVHLKGLVKSGTIGTAIFLLPVGYRPAATWIFPTISNDAFARLEIASGGNVIASIGSATWFSLAGITYLAEQ